MKIFVPLQTALIAIVIIIGFIMRTHIPDKGVVSLKTYDDLKDISPDVITSFDSVSGSPFDALEGKYSNLYDDTYSSVLFLCTALDDYSFTDGLFTQKIRIDKTISGDCPDEGETIKLIINGGFSYCKKGLYYYQINNKNADDEEDLNERIFVLNLYGINFMKPNHQYFVSALRKDNGSFTYYGTASGQINWLDLQENTNILLNSNNSSYSEYCDNEFFCESQGALKYLNRKKNEIFSKYGIIN